MHFMVTDREVGLYIGEGPVYGTFYKRTVGAILIMCQNIKRFAIFHDAGEVCNCVLIYA